MEQYFCTYDELGKHRQIPPFPKLYADNAHDLGEDAWRKYYTYDFLLVPMTARYWRLPVLRDLPSSDDSYMQHRRRKVQEVAVGRNILRQEPATQQGSVATRQAYEQLQAFIKAARPIKAASPIPGPEPEAQDNEQSPPDPAYLAKRREEQALEDPSALKLPRWAKTVADTLLRQHVLSTETMRQIALTTLQHTITRQREAIVGVTSPDVDADAAPKESRPYSVTQADFWLQQMRFGERSSYIDLLSWGSQNLGVEVARGHIDTRIWRKSFSWDRWFSETARHEVIGPDLLVEFDYEALYAYGGPDGGVGTAACARGWEPEVGSEEEIDFLVAVAVKEVGPIAKNGDLDYSVRSHLLFGLLQAAFLESNNQSSAIEQARQAVVSTGRLDEPRSHQWFREALQIMQPYVSEGQTANIVATFSQVLTENGQLFARWSMWPRSSPGFNFALKPTATCIEHARAHSGPNCFVPDYLRPIGV